MEPEIYTLKIPLTLKDGSIVSEITIVRPKVKDLRKLPEEVFNGEAKNPIVFLPMIASIVGIEESELEEMDVSDLIKISTKLSDFLADSRPTGGTL